MRLELSPLGPADVGVLPPDIVWLGGVVGDFAIETDPTQNGVGGFQARNPIATAVWLLLFSDRRCAVSDLKLGLNGDRRGWPGDGFDVDTASGEAPLGSLLYLYRRSALVEMTPAEISAEAKSSLQPLIVQKVCVEINATTTIIDRTAGSVELDVQLVGRDGAEVFAGKFGPLWARVQGI